MNNTRLKSKESAERIVVFCAHPDDEVFGAGGTIAKYAQEGKKVTSIIFSYGEDSHPWLQRKVTVKTRVKESKTAGCLLGSSETIFFGLAAEKLPKSITQRRVERRIKDIILKKQPNKIFVHAGEDSHVAHKAVHKAVMSALDKLKYKCDVYAFNIWGFFGLKSSSPKLVVDVSKTFRTKIKALYCFKSQRLSLISLIPFVYINAMRTGFNYHCTFAEVFRKVM